MKSYNELLKIKENNISNYQKTSVSILSDQTIHFLSKIIRKMGIVNLIDISIWEAPINQIDQQILNDNSEFNNNSFETVIIFESSHSLLKKFNLLEDKEKFAIIEFERIKNLLEKIVDSSNINIILFNFYELNDFTFGNYSSKNNVSFIYQLRKLNFLISEYSLKNIRISILDISSIQNRIGSEKMFDSKMYINYDMILTLDSIPYVSKNIIDIILVQKSLFKKCLILDLDNTLWGGIIGDDGIENIELGQLGIGKCFVEFQSWIKKLKDRGIIICICSKNDEKIAKNVFINHPNMVLKLDDISIFVANWNSKVDNIKSIQKALNINFDSIVFIDDNPFERDSVKNQIPDICVPNIPEDPADYLSFLCQENLFETVSTSELDKDRTKLYQTEFKRIKTKNNFTDLSSYMSSLNMVSKVEGLNKFNIPRVSQLSQRSNQFNVRTIRYSEDELIKIMKSKKYYSLIFSLNDKFGDYGIISFMILKKVSKNQIFIENWAMSCRVIERGVEEFIINYIMDFSKKHFIKNIISEYLETKKNKLVENLFPKLGFFAFQDKYKLEVNSNSNLLETNVKLAK